MHVSHEQDFLSVLVGKCSCNLTVAKSACLIIVLLNLKKKKNVVNAVEVVWELKKLGRQEQK
jgi:hypothetical protein